MARRLVLQDDGEELLKREGIMQVGLQARLRVERLLHVPPLGQRHRLLTRGGAWDPVDREKWPAR